MSTELYHPREYFDPYGVLLELGDWSYIVDDTHVDYVNDWYPYSKPVRLAPAISFYSWSNEYVTVHPTAQPHIATAALQLTLRRRGLGTMVVNYSAELNLQSQSAVIDPDDLTEPLRHQAQVKTRRILDLLAADRIRQRTPPYPPAPLTAADLEEQRQRHDDEPD